MSDQFDQFLNQHPMATRMPFEGGCAYACPETGAVFVKEYGIDHFEDQDPDQIEYIQW